MCMACQMDEMWMLYLEQQAKLATSKTDDAGDAATSDGTPAATGTGSARPLPFACEDPTKA
jgi:hypothetical protein